MSLTIHRKVLGLFSRRFRPTRRQVLAAMRHDYLRKYAEHPFDGTLFDVAVMVALDKLADEFKETLDSSAAARGLEANAPVLLPTGQPR